MFRIPAVALFVVFAFSATDIYAQPAPAERTPVIITAFNKTDIQPAAFTFIFSKYRDDGDGVVKSNTTVEATGREVQVVAEGFLAYDFNLPAGDYYISAFKAYYENGVRTEYPMLKTVRFKVEGGPAVYMGHYTVEPGMSLRLDEAVSDAVLSSFSSVDADLEAEIRLLKGTAVEIRCITDGFKITNSCRNAEMKVIGGTGE